jgi:multidrug efflux pump subunit AcrA (membrane-fusion protein)
MTYMQKQFAKMSKNMPAAGAPGAQANQRMTAGAASPASGPVQAPLGSGAAQASGNGPATGGSFPAMPQGGFGGTLPDGSKMVWVKDGKGGIRPNPIKVGIDNGTYVEIMSGLKEGDEVVVSMSGAGIKASTTQNNRNRGPFPF